MTDSLFDTLNALPEIDPAKDYTLELIGEGKKYKDAQAAARALLEKDNFIQRLQAENAEARKQLQQGSKIDEFLDKMKNVIPNPDATTQPANQPSAVVSGQTSQNTSTNKSELTLEQVKELLREQEEAKVTAVNYATVVNQLQ